MNDMINLAFEAITAQQGTEHTTAWMVGEQLKDILQAEPEHTELVLKDIGQKGMGIADCEKKIHAYADELHKKLKGNSVAVGPMEAEKIIREFYGLPERGTAVQPAKVSKSVSLEDFF